MTRLELKSAEDADLVGAIESWSEAALGEAYDRHAGRVHAVARGVLRDEALADDIVQETFLHLWTHPDKFDAERGALGSYLLARARGKSIDMLRSDASRKRREERNAREAAVLPRPDIDREVWAHSVAETLGRYIQLLPQTEREPIELAYFAGHTYREVAEMLGQPEGTVKSRIRTGLRRLRGYLAEEGVAPV